MAAATERDARVARVIDREVAPVWHDRFARMIYRELPMSDGSFVLDIHCGSGRTTSEILQRMDSSSRVLAIDVRMPESRSSSSNRSSASAHEP